MRSLLGLSIVVVLFFLGCEAPRLFEKNPIPKLYRTEATYHQVGRVESTPEEVEPAVKDQVSTSSAETSEEEIEQAIVRFQRLRATPEPKKDDAWAPFLETMFNYLDQPAERLHISPLIRARVAAEFELDTQKREAEGASQELTLLVTELLRRIDLQMGRLRHTQGKDRFTPTSLTTGKYCWPLSFGLITSNFGLRKNPFSRNEQQFHNGVDLAAPPDEPVYATAGGKVIFADWSGVGGRMIRIRHDEHTESVYAHLSTILVKADQEVTQGEVIALVGRSGRTTGHHLHFSMSTDGKSIDPLDQLPPVPGSFSDATPGIAFGFMEE